MDLMKQKGLVRELFCFVFGSEVLEDFKKSVRKKQKRQRPANFAGLGGKGPL